jgi:hypothetical protein
MAKGWALLQNHFLVLYVERWQNGINLKSMMSNRWHESQEVETSFYAPFILFRHGFYYYFLLILIIFRIESVRFSH